MMNGHGDADEKMLVCDIVLPYDTSLYAMRRQGGWVGGWMDSSDLVDLYNPHMEKMIHQTCLHAPLLSQSD